MIAASLASLKLVRNSEPKKETAQSGKYCPPSKFALSRTLLHTYIRHDHHHHHHHIITSWSSSSHHHIMIIIAWKFATPSEQYVGRGNNINFIFMRGQNSPPPLNNTLVGVLTSMISPWGIKVRHHLSSWGIKICNPLWRICRLE